MAFLLKKHYYFSDFYIKSQNIIIEIKSKYWNNMHNDLNEIKKEACLKHGYNYILIEDKNYDDIENILRYEKDK